MNFSVVPVRVEVRNVDIPCMAVVDPMDDHQLFRIRRWANSWLPVSWSGLKTNMMDRINNTRTDVLPVVFYDCHGRIIDGRANLREMFKRQDR